MSTKITLTATIQNVSTALKWILDMRATSVTLTIDPDNNKAEFRHTSKMGELIPGYREHPITCEKITGNRKVSVYLDSPDQLSKALKLANIEKTDNKVCTIIVKLTDTGSVESVRMTAGANNAVLDTSKLSRSKKPHISVIGSAPSSNINNSIRIARSINHRDDPSGRYVIFKLNEENQLEVMTSASVPMNSVALIYTAPFIAPLSNTDEGLAATENLKVGISITPELHNFTAEHTELICGSNENFLAFGFRDTETGAIALYTDRDVKPEAIQSFRSFFTKLSSLELSRQLEIDMGHLKETLLTMSSVNTDVTEADIDMLEGGKVLVRLGDWVTELTAVNKDESPKSITARVDYRAFTQFVTARTGRTATIGFQPTPPSPSTADLAIHTSDDGGGHLFVVSQCHKVQDK